MIWLGTPSGPGVFPVPREYIIFLQGVNGDQCNESCGGIAA
jgi:hypothetical protein